MTGRLGIATRWLSFWIQLFFYGNPSRCVLEVGVLSRRKELAENQRAEPLDRLGVFFDSHAEQRSLCAIKKKISQDAGGKVAAHVSVGMARKIQEAVRKVTDKPILYLVNTNYHGDHTFGNDSFPVETKIVAHVKTAERMRNIDGEKEFLLPLLENDRGLLEDVQLRLPDLVFERSLRIDLGGRFVEIYHFGHGNTPGDTIVYVPEDRVAWTGNFILGQGSIPFLIEGKADEWIRSLSRFTQRLQVDAIVPGHGKMTDRRIVVRYLTYLNRLLGTVRDQIRDGRSERDALARNPLSSEFLPQADSDTEAAAVLRGFHLWTVQRVYRDLSK